MKRVILESPYAGDVAANKRYARKALKHSLSLGEAPIASHLLYTQVLDDDKPNEREQGIMAGLAWRAVAEAAVFYADRGITTGMQRALSYYAREKIPVEFRYIQGQRPAAANRNGSSQKSSPDE